jgi:hypothetical protein
MKNTPPKPEPWHKLTGAERSKRFRIRQALGLATFLPRPKKGQK